LLLASIKRVRMRTQNAVVSSQNTGGLISRKTFTKIIFQITLLSLELFLVQKSQQLISILLNGHRAVNKLEEKNALLFISQYEAYDVKYPKIFH
jgi:hypothetical protein